MITILTVYTVQQPKFKPLEPYLNANSETEVVRLLENNNVDNKTADYLFSQTKAYATIVFGRDNNKETMGNQMPSNDQFSLI